MVFGDTSVLIPRDRRRRRLLCALGTAAVSIFATPPAFGQGRCRDGYATRSCPLTEAVATAPIKPGFAPTRWKTVALDHITFRMADYRKEAAFYIALMGWRLRSDDGNQAVLDIGTWGSAVFQHAPQEKSVRVTNFAFVIEPWNAVAVEGELRKRGLNPIAENDAQGFESFHVRDPDGWDLQLCNGNGLAKARKTPPTGKLSPTPPFPSTGWNTVWLDHLSFGAGNYKRSASFYSNLLGWQETYDEGSQHELMIGDVGDILIRGPNPNEPGFAARTKRTAIVDHISFGISPWNTDGVKRELLQRGLTARPDTSTADEIHQAAYKSYHTRTPNGFNLQISYLKRDTRLTLAKAVKPKKAQGR